MKANLLITIKRTLVTIALTVDGKESQMTYADEDDTVRKHDNFSAKFKSQKGIYAIALNCAMAYIREFIHRTRNVSVEWNIKFNNTMSDMDVAEKILEGDPAHTELLVNDKKYFDKIGCSVILNQNPS